MTAKVISVTPTTSLKETALAMATHGISGVPVIDDREMVVGVISENDFLSHMAEKKPGSIMHVIAQCLSTKGCIAIPMRTGHAKDIMTSPAYTVSESTPIFEIVWIILLKISEYVVKVNLWLLGCACIFLNRAVHLNLGRRRRVK